LRFEGSLAIDGSACVRESEAAFALEGTHTQQPRFEAGIQRGRERWGRSHATGRRLPLHNAPMRRARSTRVDDEDNQSADAQQCCKRQQAARRSETDM